MAEKKVWRCYGVDFVGFEAVPLGPNDDGMEDYGSANDGGGVAIGSIVRLVYVCLACGTSFSVPLDLSNALPTGNLILKKPLCPEGCNKGA